MLSYRKQLLVKAMQLKSYQLSKRQLKRVEDAISTLVSILQDDSMDIDDDYIPEIYFHGKVLDSIYKSATTKIGLMGFIGLHTLEGRAMVIHQRPLTKEEIVYAKEHRPDLEISKVVVQTLLNNSGVEFERIYTLK